MLGVGLISLASVFAALKISNALASTSLSLSPICGCGGGGGADVDVNPPPLVFVFPDADPSIDMGNTIGFINGGFELEFDADADADLVDGPEDD